MSIKTRPDHRVQGQPAEGLEGVRLRLRRDQRRHSLRQLRSPVEVSQRVQPHALLGKRWMEVNEPDNPAQALTRQPGVLRQIMVPLGVDDDHRLPPGNGLGNHQIEKPGLPRPGAPHDQRMTLEQVQRDVQVPVLVPQTVYPMAPAQLQQLGVRRFENVPGLLHRRRRPGERLAQPHQFPVALPP